MPLYLRSRQSPLTAFSPVRISGSDREVQIRMKAIRAFALCHSRQPHAAAGPGLTMRPILLQIPFSVVYAIDLFHHIDEILINLCYIDG